MSSESPTQIGEYVVIERFAETAAAELFKAQKEGRGPLVCVKRMRRSDEGEDEEFVASFAREVETAAALRHPNIVRVREWGEDGGHHFLVMELIEGPDLAALLGHAGPLAPDIVAHVGASLARALLYIHHRGEDHPPLIHCDVSPHNVLVDGSGSVKLSDFGLARALKTTGAATLTRQRGKAGYLAPEQLEAEASITSSVDLFALGLVLWQSLIGTHPYVERCPPGRSLQRWIPAQLRKNTRRRVADAAPTAPAGLCAAIERLLQPLSDRTPSAADVLAAMEPHIRPASAEMLGQLAASTPLESDH